MPYQKVYSQMDLSGGIQVSTSHLLQKKNEVNAATNANFNKVIGSATRRNGYEKVGRTIEHGKDSLGACVYNYGDNNKLVIGINKDDDSVSTLRILDKDDYYTTILSAEVPNIKFDFCNFLDELYVTGLSDSGYYFPTANIDQTLTPSYTRNLIGAPYSEFITEYDGSLYALNCSINGKIYRDRAYFTSPPLGAITYVLGDQKGLLKQLKVDATRYLKAGMQIDIYGAGTEAKKQSAITIISVDKNNKVITFDATSIDVEDNDELWLVGRKGELSLYWNTDDPTPEDADYILLPPGRDAYQRYTGYGKSNSRLFMFSRNSMIKWDGSSLITISDTVGCVSHRTIQNIGDWLIWLHSSGVWAYNDKTGQGPTLLSRGIDKYIKAINQGNYSRTSAGVIDKVYKLAVGEIAELDTATTSTSTSSTSTSSTSSSTSSTSTSSTSTSSTSTSTTVTTTSTSSTSTSSTSSSTSSTSSSISTSSTSSSTSTSSTSTSTMASIKKCFRLCYDFDMNTWWVETHKREMRCQFQHTMHGYTKLYFTDETGRLMRDDTTNADNGEAIPFEVELGRCNLGTEQTKNLLSAVIDCENPRGLMVQYSIDGGDYKTLGQCTKQIETLTFPQGGQNIEGRDISYKFVHNNIGEPPCLNGINTYFSVAERIVYERWLRL